MKKQLVIYPRVIERIEDWPIYQLSRDRANFIHQIDSYTVDRLLQRYKKDLTDVLVKTIYMERIRIKEEPWKIDPPNERTFWNRISSKLIQRSLDREDPAAKEAAESILRQVVNRYSEEIVGTFHIGTFRFMQRFATFLFNRLFNAAVSKGLLSIWRGRRQLYERLNVVGDVEKVRELFQHGTVVVVPTHSSNLDSLLVGYAMDQIMGLPSFSYGAGLNLYNFGPAAYFMNRLGAYRVDRRKKNTIYLETLKAMSNLSIQRGVNSLFFPGGTRSRSGAIEDNVKLGLLGTAVEAQRALCAAGVSRKVFIVPMVIGYHFVLEAPFLIEQHLKRTGKENYIRQRDEGSSVLSWARFIWRFFSTTSDITLSVGRPMDVLGNFVDARGVSYDQYGNALDIQDYFLSQGQVTDDRQREEEYTRLLADRIVERYRAENVVLSSHLVAFAVFKMLMRQNPKLDLYGILRLPHDDFRFPLPAVAGVIEQLQNCLFKLEADQKIKLSPEIRLPAGELVLDGVKRLGIFHQDKPLSIAKDGSIVSANFRVLYFYHNRLDNYDLEEAFSPQAENIRTN